MSETPTESGVDFIPDDQDWETVEEESGQKLAFNNPGEQFVGVYVGTETIHPENGDSFDQQRFRDDAGTLYAINGGHKLRSAFEGVESGAICRITYMGEIDTGQPSPMKDYRVEIAKKGAAKK